MRNYKYIWVVGLLATLVVIIIPMVIFLPKGSGKTDDPWLNLPQRTSHVDHTSLLEGPFETGSDVTQRCLECHPEAAEQMLEADPALRIAFEERLTTDEEFAANPRQRLEWFYERSPLLDSNWRLYPVGRELP